jgi:transcriptional regulator with XRE-family HTH domain
MALRIRELREAKGLTQLQLGEMAGLSRSQLSEIETETKPANTLRLASIARALGVHLDELFEESQEESYRAVILDLMRSMPAEDRDAVIRHAQALSRTK